MAATGHSDARRVLEILYPHPDGDEGLYACKVWDPSTRLCMEYERRPRMCRGYPDYGKGGRCEHDGCEINPPARAQGFRV